MGMGVAGIVIDSYCWSFPHSQAQVRKTWLRMAWVEGFKCGDLSKRKQPIVNQLIWDFFTNQTMAEKQLQ